MTVLPELERHLVEAAAGPSAPPRPARRRARVGGWLAIAASAAVVIGVVVVFAAVGGQAPRLTGARAQLERAAQIAAGTAGPTLGQGQGWYTHVVGTSSWGSYKGSSETDKWIVASGQDFDRGSSQSSSPDRQSSNPPPVGLASTDPVYGVWDLHSVRGFPADPAGVLRAVQSDLPKGAPAGSVTTLAALTAILADEPLSGASRAAAFRAIELLPGLRYLGTVRDARGRPGLAVAEQTGQGPRGLNGGSARHRYEFQMIFDPTTATVLGSRTVVIQPPPVRGIHAGSVIVTWAYSRPRVAEIPTGMRLNTPSARRAVERALAPVIAAQRHLNRPGGPCSGAVTGRCLDARRALGRRSAAIISATLKRLAGDG
jgi:hypothetical protein